MNSYAYNIHVKGVKVSGGSIHADNMDDAARKAAKYTGLTIKRSPSVWRPCDGAMIPQAQFMRGNDLASVLVYASPEYLEDL